MTPVSQKEQMASMNRLASPRRSVLTDRETAAQGTASRAISTRTVFTIPAVQPAVRVISSPARLRRERLGASEAAVLNVFTPLRSTSRDRTASSAGQNNELKPFTRFGPSSSAMSNNAGTSPSRKRLVSSLSRAPGATGPGNQPPQAVEGPQKKKVSVASVAGARPGSTRISATCSKDKK